MTMAAASTDDQQFDRVVERFIANYEGRLDIISTTAETEGRFLFREQVTQVLYVVLAMQLGVPSYDLDRTQRQQMDYNPLFGRLLAVSTVADEDIVATRALLKSSGFSADGQLANPGDRYDAFVHVTAAALRKLGLNPVHQYLVNQAIPHGIHDSKTARANLFASRAGLRIISAIDDWMITLDRDQGAAAEFADSVELSQFDLDQIGQLVEADMEALLLSHAHLRQLLHPRSETFRAYCALTYLVMRRFGLRPSSFTS